MHIALKSLNNNKKESIISCHYIPTVSKIEEAYHVHDLGTAIAMGIQTERSTPSLGYVPLQ